MSLLFYTLLRRQLPQHDIFTSTREILTESGRGGIMSNDAPTTLRSFPPENCSRQPGSNQ